MDRSHQFTPSVLVMAVSVALFAAGTAGAEEKGAPSPSDVPLLRAQAFLERGNFSGAARLLRRTAIDPATAPVAREESIRTLFAIANRWLDDTRQEMARSTLCQSCEDGRNSTGSNDRTSQRLTDKEKQSLRLLAVVHDVDPQGALAAQALFLSGSVSFYRAEYRRADAALSELLRVHPDSPLPAKSLELALLSKSQLAGRGVGQSCRLAEMRELIARARRDYPELYEMRADFLQRQLLYITLREAERDFRAAEERRRHGDLCAAVAGYESVRCRYPGTRFADLAGQRLAAWQEGGW